MKHLEYNKLRNTIIENSKVIKEEVMSLEFWCEIQTPNGRGTFIEDVQDVYSLWEDWEEKVYSDVTDIWDYVEKYGEYEVVILWKDIEIRHLQWFCDEKDIGIIIDNWAVVINWRWWIYLDHCLPLKDQDPNELEKINNYLIDNIK